MMLLVKNLEIILCWLSGDDGIHRAKAFNKLGYAKIPVAIPDLQKLLIELIYFRRSGSLGN
jgi:hypothetical protein